MTKSQIPSLSSVISHFSSVISHFSSVISHLSSVISHLSSVISHLSSVISHLSFVIYLMSYVIILLLAAFLRLYRLDSVPPGVTHDEAAHLQDARRIWEGARPIYLSSANGREPFYDYVTAPLVGLLGMHVFVGRFSSVLWGLALVVLTYVALRGPLGPAGALGAALLVAVSFWPLSTSRQALRSITMPVLFAAAIALFWRGVYGRDAPGGRPGWFVGAGALLGLGFYTYVPARVAWVVPVLFWLSLALTDRSRFRAHWRGMLLMLVVMAAVAAPLLVYLARHPGLEMRVEELAQPLEAALAGNPELLLRRVGEAALMFSHRGDTHWMYNLSGRPLLPLPLVIPFYLGLVLALLRLKKPGPRLLLLWLVVGIAPALVTGVESCSLRAIAAQPAVFGLCALPFVEIGRWARSRPSLFAISHFSFVISHLSFVISSFVISSFVISSFVISSFVIFLALSGWVAADAAQTYFVAWAEHRDVRVAYHAHLAAEAAYLEQRAEAGPTGISTFYPSRPHDPSAMEVLRGQADAQLRWFDGRGALAFPALGQARLLVPAAVPLDPALEEMVAPYARPLAAIQLHPTDFVTQVAVLEWDADAALGAAVQGMDGPVGIYPRDSLPADYAYRPLALPVELGERLMLVGYRLLTPSVDPGGEVVLVTLWETRGPEETELVLFAHLLGEGSHPLGQSDRLDAPAWNWQPGDVFAQVHRFFIPADTPPGRYHLQVGAYWQEDGSRLPVLVAGETVDTRVLLQPLEVRQP